MCAREREREKERSESERRTAETHDCTNSERRVLLFFIIYAHNIITFVNKQIYIIIICWMCPPGVHEKYYALGYTHSLFLSLSLYF